MRNILACLSLIGLFLLSGCGQRDQDSAGSSKKESAVTGAPAPETNSSDADSATNTAQEDMADKETEDAADGAQDYPYEQLVSAADDSRLTQAYKDSEDQVRQAPQDTDRQIQRAYLLYYAGSLLMRNQASEQARLAFDAAFQSAEQLVKKHPDLPADYHEPLASIYYEGASVRALEGKADAAKAALKQAIEWGWSDMEAIANDPDLANVRSLPGFDAEMASWREAARQALLQQAREDLTNGETFPLDFTVNNLAGEELKLADLKGKVVIVDFWGTWCPPCREEIPSFIKLQETYAERGLQIIGLNYENVDDDEAKAKLAKDYAEANGINYPLALGTEEIMAQVPQFEGFPTTVFIDRTGKVRLKIVGLHEYAYLESLVVTLLDENAAEPPAETPGTP